MADILIWLIAALGAVGGVMLGRLWGRTEGKRLGKLEGDRDAISDKIERTERGRKAVQVGRGSGDPTHRLHNNDARW